jgi:hypothetical protein
MSKIMKYLLGTAIAVIVAVIFLWGFSWNHHDLLGQEKSQNAAKIPPRVSVQNGETVLTLDGETQSKLGLKVALLQETSMRGNLTVPAVVISVQDLVTLRTSYVEAQSRLEKAQANAEVARKEYDRLKALFREDQNASQKALQAAEGASRVDAAEARAASAELDLQATAVRESWGSVVEKWLTGGGSTLRDVLDLREMMVQITLPAGQTAAPQTVSLEMPGAALARASLVSPFPRVDPRLQGTSFLYELPARPSLAPGLNLVAHLSIGRILKGVMVPEAAVVWSGGKAWVYQQTGPNRFTRRGVTTDTPTGKGFFVAQVFSPGDKVVIGGAQLLLSEEFRPQVPTGGGGDTD